MTESHGDLFSEKFWKSLFIYRDMQALRLLEVLLPYQKSTESHKFELALSSFGDPVMSLLSCV